MLSMFDAVLAQSSLNMITLSFPLPRSLVVRFTLGIIQTSGISYRFFSKELFDSTYKLYWCFCREVTYFSFHPPSDVWVFVEMSVISISSMLCRAGNISALHVSSHFKCIPQYKKGYLYDVFMKVAFRV